MNKKRGARYSRPTLSEANPPFLGEWDNELNGEAERAQFTIGSDFKLWWRCSINPAHRWQASPSNRFYGKTGCPYCAGRKVNFTNCLATTHPDLARQWHPSKNNDLTPETVSAGSHKKAYWQCENGHEWKAAIHSRSLGRGCPYCRGYYASPESSVGAQRPDLLADWHPTKNTSLDPKEVSLGSDKLIWWVCRYGHEWQARVYSRHSLGSGCPKCTRQTSKPEIRCFCELKTIFPDIGHRVKVATRLEVDLLIPSCGIAIQYDGRRYHANKVARDVANTSAVEALGYRVVRLRDHSLPEIGITVPIDEDRELSSCDLARLLRQLHAVSTVDPVQLAAIHEYTLRDQFVDEQGYIDLCSALPGPLPGESLQESHPRIAAGWHIERNGRLSPAHVTAGSTMKVYWKCERHESYLASVNHRVRGRGCPYCARRTVLPEDSLAALYPDLALEFHPSRNQEKAPSQIAPGSGTKYWWKCPKNPRHEWDATVMSRVSGAGCPICANKKVIHENSLATLAPEIAKQWHYEKNYPLRPDDVPKGSHKVVWWRCSVEETHEWSASIKNRTRVGSGCPYCDGKMTDPKRSLAVVLPELALEWHPILNNRSAHSVLAGSGLNVWWMCSIDPAHIWQARIESRSKGFKKCPHCATPPASLSLPFGAGDE
jgi:hypothetical protein